jgi:hypothetical protein
MAYEFEPTVVVSKNGRHIIAFHEFEGVHAIPNRDAVGFYFTGKSPRWDGEGRISVLFSGTSLMSEPKYFGLPDYRDRDANFVQFALAAVGDYLDDVGLPAQTPSGVAATKIEAFSGRFQEWKKRSVSSDDDVLTYMGARLYWTWKYRGPRTLFTSHDMLRLGIEVADLHRLALLEERRLWTTHSKSAFGISLEPTPELLRNAKTVLEPPVASSTGSETGQTSESPPTADPTKGDTATTERASEKSSSALPPPTKKRRKSPRKLRKGKGSDSTSLVFVDEARLSDLRKVSSADFDLRKLIAVCDELNVCYRSQCYLGVAALTRTLLDHVPPIFGVDTFAKVANNYSGGKSFKASMQHLESSARNIADGHLHGQIRQKESLPTRTQVNFAADVDVLLAEIVRVLG